MVTAATPAVCQTVRRRGSRSTVGDPHRDWTRDLTVPHMLLIVDMQTNPFDGKRIVLAGKEVIRL